MIKSSQILRNARELLERDGGWCQGAVARSAGGSAVAAVSRQAAAFTLDGAIESACSPNGFSIHPIMTVLKYLPTYTARWNDEPERTKAEIIAAVDVAMALAALKGD